MLNKCIHKGLFDRRETHPISTLRLWSLHHRWSWISPFCVSVRIIINLSPSTLLRWCKTHVSCLKQAIENATQLCNMTTLCFLTKRSISNATSINRRFLQHLSYWVSLVMMSTHRLESVSCLELLAMVSPLRSMSSHQLGSHHNRLTLELSPVWSSWRWCHLIVLDLISGDVLSSIWSCLRLKLI